MFNSEKESRIKYLEEDVEILKNIVDQKAYAVEKIKKMFGGQLLPVDFYRDREPVEEGEIGKIYNLKIIVK